MRRLELRAERERRKCARDARGRRDEHLRKRHGLLHRGLDAVHAERIRRLLGEVDDVVECRRERMPVTRCERQAGAVADAEATDDLARDAIAFVLAALDVLDERRVLGVVDEQVAQQQRHALDVQAGLLEQSEDLGIHDDRATQACHSGHPNPRARGRISAVRNVHTRFTRCAPEPARGWAWSARLGEERTVVRAICIPRCEDPVIRRRRQWAAVADRA